MFLLLYIRFRICPKIKMNCVYSMIATVLLLVPFLSGEKIKNERNDENDHATNRVSAVSTDFFTLLKLWNRDLLLESNSVL